jgi:hypothetical protein
MTELNYERQIVEQLEAELDAVRALPVVTKMPPIEGDAEVLACEIVNFRYVRLITALLEITPRAPENGFIRVEAQKLLQNLFQALKRNDVIIDA